MHGLRGEMVEMDTKTAKYYSMPSLTFGLEKGIIKILAQNQEKFRR